MESIILKGIASQLLQMNKPTYSELKKMLVECNALSQVCGNFQEDSSYEFQNKETFEKHNEKITDTSKEYKYRGLYSTISGWYVQGKDEVNKCAGILEWCRDMGDAMEMKLKMEEYPQFSNLKISSVNLDNAKLGEFVFTFAEALYYLIENPEGNITYESATEGAYVKVNPFNKDLLQLNNEYCVADREFYSLKNNLKFDYSNEKWAIVA